MRHKGPYTAHIAYAATVRRPAHTVEVVRATFKAAENALYWRKEGVLAKWITNAEGVVYSRESKGGPIT